MIQLEIRRDYEPSATFWKNFWNHCSELSDDFRGVTSHIWVCEHLADEYFGRLITEGGKDYSRNMWLEFATAERAEWFLLKFS